MGTWKKFVDIIIYTRMGIEKKSPMDEKKLPFMTPEEIVDLVTYISRDSIMLEIGGGDSTVFLSRLVKKIVTLEHNLEWAEKIRGNTKGYESTVFVVEPNWPQSHPFQPAEEGQFENYLNFLTSLDDDQFDVILIDGRDRVKCVNTSLTKLKSGGILLVHDFWNRPKYHSILNNIDLELILDSNSYGKNPNNTLVAFRKK
jgi:predicted O-methyltransferase YrrM